MKKKEENKYILGHVNYNNQIYLHSQNGTYYYKVVKQTNWIRNLKWNKLILKFVYQS